MKVTPARRAALEVLRAQRRGELLDRALAGAVEGVPARERAWVQELVYGTVRLRGRLDHMLGAFVRRGLGSLDPDTLDILRLGAYQLLEMGSVPAYAAVSQAVELAKQVRGAGAGRLVNGVLQSLGRQKDEVRFPDFADDAVGYLSTWGSHPRWLVERWVARFGVDEARALVEANNTRPELFLRPVGEAPDAALRGLEAAGIEAARVTFAPDALRVAPPATALHALAAVPAVVQDPAASLVVRYAAVPAGATVADVCAAPGGKAVALAGRAGYVAAADLSFDRLTRVRENAERVGRLPLGLVVADAREPPFRPVDVVLVDAPCTGTGTLRRHPDGKWRLRPEDPAALAGLQAELLETSSSIVTPGGLLVYATCSLEPEENEEQMEAFLSAHPEFEPAPPPEGLDPRMLDAAGRLLVLPQLFGVDGAFATRLRRRS
ncbi:MAG TPA: 16S rRNA (cytosine(967)-C(5))-methyltransferase RsmB [Longimicrobiales bacterium]|nr:16S rRNA (cytosine(967)-C(5))-methyltransferase RsmB [Longimicrobiales bacterium]